MKEKPFSFNEFVNLDAAFIKNESLKGRIHLIDGPVADIYQFMFDNNIKDIALLDEQQLSILREYKSAPYAAYLANSNS